ncbi:MAG: hypothetical protein KFB93_00290 [Simkaniaceae bacterium]|nr:MAG: hypothetical protein KFB93_00290 [Simkaniaceae bacterium]
MLDIISHAPIYIWVILALLLWKGWRASRTNTVSWKDLIIIPVVMLIWTTYSITKNYGPLFILPWVASVSMGVGLGLFMIRKSSLRFDKKRKLIEFSGSWIPMVLLLSIFSLRFFLGATYGVHPELKGSLKLLIVENFATVISAIFLGRLMGTLKRFKQSPHVDLSSV